jgi:hypothetical protein
MVEKLPMSSNYFKVNNLSHLESEVPFTGRPVPVLYIFVFSCFDVGSKTNTVFLRTDDLLSDTCSIRLKNLKLGEIMI